MSSLASIPGGRDQVVTSSELVRQFGVWQDRAQRAPVYVLHRGRPRLVLTSLDLMDALCAPHDRDAGAAAQQLAAILDGAHEAIVLADTAGRVVAAGRAARSRFGIALGEAVADIAPGDPFVGSAIDRVLATRAADTAEFMRDGRDYAVVVEPSAAGVALFIHDVTAALAERGLAAGAAAFAAAAAADGGVATVRIGLRGYIETPDEALATLTGIAPEALATARFVALLSIDSRVAAGDAIEAAIAGDAQALDATLLVNRGAALPVRIALAPLRGARAVEAVAAIVRARGA